jgi:hypothetical protein
LLNQSAEGFAIAAESLNVPVGRRIQLRTRRGWSDAEVIRCETQGVESILGLKLLQDLPDPRDTTRNSLALFLPRPATQFPTKSSRLLQLAALCILAFWLYLAYTFFW